MSHNRPYADEHCAACALSPSRRDFIRRIAVTLSGAFASLGMSRRTADSMPVSSIDALATDAFAITYPIPAVDGAQIDKKNEVILVRWHNAVYAFNLACPHQNVALRWYEKDRRFKCPKHNSRYEPDGTFVDGRATRGLDRFTVTLDGTNVVVDVNAMHKQDEDAPGWAAAMVKLPTDVR